MLQLEQEYRAGTVDQLGFLIGIGVAATWGLRTWNHNESIATARAGDVLLTREALAGQERFRAGLIWDQLQWECSGRCEQMVGGTRLRYSSTSKRQNRNRSETAMDPRALQAVTMLQPSPPSGRSSSIHTPWSSIYNQNSDRITDHTYLRSLPGAEWLLDLGQNQEDVDSTSRISGYTV